MDLLELATRVEEASGPDRMLDHDIADALCLPQRNRGALYTSSLDAAMSLVPEGWVIASLREMRLRTRYGVELWRCEDGLNSSATSLAATPALALTAAALRALASQEGKT